MKVLIVGGGGREHALAWKAGQGAGVSEVLVAPGNAGTAREPRTRNVSVAADDVRALVNLARERDVALTIVGPEAPLVHGVVDALEAERLPVFGPRQAAAQLEGSKAFCKGFLSRHGIPTAAWEVFEERARAEAFVRRMGAPLVVKADGLAAGKGVLVCASEDEALAAVASMLEGGAFGDAGRRVVIEDFLEGEEASFICLVDGETVLPLATSQDHKPRDDGDRGPNTGGMGAYSPAPIISDEIHARIMNEVLMPTVRGLASEGRPYRGFLYAGLMIARDGTPNVLEFNCRCGDPETQPIMMRLRSDLVEICLAATQGRLDRCTAEWDPRVCLGVVMTAGGYPGEYRKGDVVEGLDLERPPEVKIFHAGTAEREGRVVTSGGRVLCLCALGLTVPDAQALAYEHAATLRWDDVYYRRDIGYRAIERERGMGP